MTQFAGLELIDQMIDSANAGVSKHLGQIADSMYVWEGPVAEQLGLNKADIAAIKTAYPMTFNLQV